MTTHETCSRCDGSGQIACQACHGTGSVRKVGAFEENKSFCTSCKGSGVERCHSCGGSGMVKIEE